MITIQVNGRDVEAEPGRNAVGGAAPRGSRSPRCATSTACPRRAPAACAPWRSKVSGA